MPRPENSPILNAIREEMGIDPDDPRLPQKVPVDVILIQVDGRWELTLTTPDGVRDKIARHPGELLDWLETWAVARGFALNLEVSVWTQSTYTPK